MIEEVKIVKTGSNTGGSGWGEMCFNQIHGSLNELVGELEINVLLGELFSGSNNEHMMHSINVNTHHK